MNSNEKLQAMKGYLREFYTKVDPKHQKLISSGINKLDSYYVSGPSKLLKEVACVYLMKFGKQNYLSLNSFDILETSLNHNEELYGGLFYKMNSSLVIIYHMKSTIPNKLLEQYLSQVISYRRVKRKRTLLLTEESLTEIESNFPEIILPVSLWELAGVKESIRALPSTSKEYEKIYHGKQKNIQKNPGKRSLERKYDPTRDDFKNIDMENLT